MNNDEFKKIAIRRGFEDIEYLYDNITKLGGYICGGYARYCGSPADSVIRAGDIDIYCKDDKSFEDMKSWLSLEGFSNPYETNVALTYNPLPDNWALWKRRTIQLIKAISTERNIMKGDPEKIISTFDFSIVRCLILDKDHILVDKDFEEDERKRKLRIKHIHCPISQVFRISKYCRKGYHINVTEVLKLFNDWDLRDDEYRNSILTLVKQKELSQEEIDNLEALLRID